MEKQQFMERVKSYITNKEHLALVEDAFCFCKEVHGDQQRQSGEPYFTHPIEVANILIDLKLGPYSICAGLLHDVIEDTKVTKEELEKRFNAEVANIVDGVTKLTQIKFISEEEKMANNHRKMLLAMSKDIRVIIVKLADRLHNMRTLSYLPALKQKRISRETLEIYAPLAHRLGMQKIKSELEDTAFKYLEHEKYQDIKVKLQAKKTERERAVNIMEIALKSTLVDKGVELINIASRVKNIFSINKKMVSKNKEFDEIYDLLAIRILVNSIEDCYKALGIIHAQWVPIPNRFKDYIAMPKPNMYQSLHTTILGNNGQIYEIQIRTNEMNDIAELGVAAHWTYKESNGKDSSAEQTEIAGKLRWYKEFQEKAEESLAEDEEFVGSVKTDLFAANVYCFTPNGDVLDFPHGSTPIDFAYRIHSEIGSRTTGAIVNGKICPINYQLKTGDIVEIRKGKDYTVNDSWLSFTRTLSARGKIKQYLNRVDKELYLEKGQKLYEKEESLVPKKEELTNKLMIAKFSRLGIDTKERLFIEIGKGRIKAKVAVRKIYGDFDKGPISDQDLIEKINSKQIVRKTNDKGILVLGLDQAKIHISKCCQPLPGDEIIGYVSKEKGVTVHKAGCKNTLNFEDERLIDVIWDTTSNKVIKYKSTLQIINNDHQGMLAKVVNAVSNKGINILEVNSSVTSKREAITKIVVEVETLAKLEDVMTSISNIKNVTEVIRVGS